MGKGSRKYKAGRALAEEAGGVLSRELLEEQQGGATRDLGDEDLFLLDTQPDNAQAHVGPQKRRRSTKDKRMTRAQVILTAGTQAKPIGTGSAYVPKKKRKGGHKRSVQVARPPLQLAENKKGALGDAWAMRPRAADYIPDEGRLATPPSALAQPNRPQIAAVEVEPAGCSYNPDYEQHQEAIAIAVAMEMQKHLDEHLVPKAAPVQLPHGDAHAREMASGLFSDDDDDDGGGDEHGEAAGSGTRDARGALNQKPAKTKSDRARQARRKAHEKAMTEKAALKTLRRQMDNSKQLQAEIDAEAAFYEKRRQRRQADVEDKAGREPPRLGRHRYQAARPQVLSSDDVTGSLRTLRSTPKVAQDRYKSLQKRGIIQVTVQQHWKKPTTRRVKQFEKKVTQEKHIANQQEIGELRRQKKSRTVRKVKV